MTSDDLAAIEASLGISLPEFYKAAMVAYPLNPEDANSQIALQNDPKAIVAFNNFLREEFADDWKPSCIAIGNSPVGDVYFLDLEQNSSAVGSWSHETFETTEESPTFAAWIGVQQSIESNG